MKERYMLSECWKMFETDNKGLQRWLERANIQPKTSEADKRTKYLTHAQLQQLATFLGRKLPEAPPVPEEPVGPYKLLLDQVNDLCQFQRTSTERIEALQSGVVDALGQMHEAWRTIDAARETFEREMDALRSTLEEKSLVWQQLSDLQLQH
jgi:hypothetical protein